MAKTYLDEVGLATLWGKIKTYVTNAIESSKVYPVRTITKSLQVGTSWMDTGIVLDPTTFPDGNGTYAVSVDLYQVTQVVRGLYYEYASGIMSVYVGSTNNENADEIPLHHNGRATNQNHIYLRTIRTAGGNGHYSKLQIALDDADTTEHTFTFTFRRIM